MHPSPFNLSGFSFHPHRGFHLMIERAVGVLAIVLFGLGMTMPATAQDRIQHPSTDSLSVDTTDTRQRVDDAAGAVMAALDSLAAQSAKKSARPRSPRTITIDGLVMDETRTKIGRDFYSIFYSRWQAPSDARNFTITVQEQPMPSLGTRITVQLNNQTVFQTRLQPRYEYIEQAAKQAVYATWRRLQRGQPTRQIY